MSGFAVLLDEDQQRRSPAARDELLNAMLGRLRHRGPDHTATAQARGCGLGHCGLETTAHDVGERQPREQGGVVIVADARLDNRAELIDSLPDDLLDEAADSDLILRAYAQWGTSCAARLRGDFSFAIWDGPREQLYCARDQLGIKPLFYLHRQGSFRCASEAFALFAGGELQPRPHLPSIALYIVDAYTENGQSLYEDVFALPSAHQLVARRGMLKLQRYWSPDPWRRLPRMGDEDYAALFRSAFGEAVRARLRSNGPVGVILSGGLDSSSVACESERQRRQGHGPSQRATLLHFDFGSLECDETSFSQAVAGRWDLPIVNLDALSQDDATDPQLSRKLPDLYYYPGALLWRALHEEASNRGIRTLFTGFGGDDCMMRTGQELVDDLAAGQLRTAARACGLTSRPLSWQPWRQLLGAWLRRRLPEPSLEIARTLRSSPRGALLAPKPWQWAAQHHRDTQRRLRARRCPDRVSAALCDRIEESVQHLVMSHTDRLAASSAVEYRHPLLDLKLFELLLSMPREQRFVTGTRKPKPVLRRAMRETLPVEVYRRVDAPIFTSHLAASMSQHAALIRSLFRDSRLEQLGLITKDHAKRAHLAVGGQALYRFLNHATMELWLRQLD